MVILVSIMLFKFKRHLLRALLILMYRWHSKELVGHVGIIVRYKTLSILCTNCNLIYCNFLLTTKHFLSTLGMIFIVCALRIKNESSSFNWTVSTIVTFVFYSLATNCFLFAIIGVNVLSKLWQISSDCILDIRRSN